MYKNNIAFALDKAHLFMSEIYICINADNLNAFSSNNNCSGNYRFELYIIENIMYKGKIFSICTMFIQTTFYYLHLFIFQLSMVRYARVFTFIQLTYNKMTHFYFHSSAIMSLLWWNRWNFPWKNIYDFSLWYSIIFTKSNLYLDEKFK